ncbi:MAG: hypothetical protein PHN74_00555 [Candidatus Pacebacteria bacterium]|nr:hypothetical protein [Candidatus Paceibacterota bacterium]
MRNGMREVAMADVQTGKQMRASAIVWLVILFAILTVICFDGLSRMGISTIILLLALGVLSLVAELLLEKYVFDSAKKQESVMPVEPELPPWKKYRSGDPLFRYPENKKELEEYIAETHPYMNREDRRKMVKEIRRKK